ncbi:MAG: 4Fe-4S dicluster domain-containing protein [Candidatus Fervidibacter sp.]|uniref:4Fe-4S dicluster domain-containing protein n=1 Tax=Candidatus Fervidibacter sp. TaxID=3100871 RepID=UPI00404B167C
MMLRKRLTKENLNKWIDELIGSGLRVIAPVRESDLTVFRPITSSTEIATDYTKTDLPFKEWLFPPTEVILRYRIENSEPVLEDPEVDATKTVALFLRPCDAAAISVLDSVFGGDYEDEFYLTRRRNLTVVGLSCTEPQPECFCTAVELSPTSEEGSDILLTPVGDEFLVEALTEKGEQLVNQYSVLFADVEGLTKERVTNEAVAKMKRTEKLPTFAETYSDIFEHPVWEDVARKCLGCGICAYSCPTCHCYDIVDEATLFEGIRCRNWDCCAFALFTLHASGHNPRPTQANRYRQRVLHKFAYFLQTYGRKMCVGCGRCVAKCPVGMDIYEIVKDVAAVSAK